MCFIIGEDDDDAVKEGGSNSGSPKFQLRNSYTWLIPRKVIMVLVAVGIIMIFFGVIMMAIGGGIGSAILRILGGILLGFGIMAIIVCLLVCFYAYFYYGTRNQVTQTTDTPWADDMLETPAYASIGRPSALKSADSTLKRNGTLGQKKVTMAPELGSYGDLPTTSGTTAVVHSSGQGQNYVVGPGGAHISGANVGQGHMQGQNVQVSGPGYNPMVVGGGVMHQNASMHAGQNIQNIHGRTMSVSSSVDGGGGTLSRGMDGSHVGTGGIRITHLDPSQQPLPSPGGSTISYAGSTAGQYHSIVGGGGGGGSVTGSVDTYAYPRSHLITGPGSTVSYDGSSSQYSTLRSIPVTHIVNDNGQRQEAVEYARVNKGGGPRTVQHVIHTSNSTAAQQQQQQQQQHAMMMASSAQNQAQFTRRLNDDDAFDYDNPVERTPMIPPSPSYHEQQMQFQRQHQHRHQQDLHAPRQINSYSLQRQTAANTQHLSEKQQQSQQQSSTSEQQQQQQQIVTLYDQQQKEYQQQQKQQSVTNSTRNSFVDDLPAPQPLVYPSARRPMTFEQVSASKMSVYDNVLANNLKEGDLE